jgi:hypothetical protein
MEIYRKRNPPKAEKLNYEYLEQAIVGLAGFHHFWKIIVNKFGAITSKQLRKESNLNRLLK